MQIAINHQKQILFPFGKLKKNKQTGKLTMLYSQGLKTGQTVAREKEHIDNTYNGEQLVERRLTNFGSDKNHQ